VCQVPQMTNGRGGQPCQARDLRRDAERLKRLDLLGSQPEGGPLASRWK
jgi:hypothetical protein